MPGATPAEEKEAKRKRKDNDMLTPEQEQRIAEIREHYREYVVNGELCISSHGERVNYLLKIIDSLKAELKTAHADADLFEANAKTIGRDTVKAMKENERLKLELAQRDAVIGELLGKVVSVRKENTGDWMQYITDAINDTLERIGDSDRVKYDGEHINIVARDALEK